jgi:hypothetical protein
MIVLSVDATKLFIKSSIMMYCRSFNSSGLTTSLHHFGPYQVMHKTPRMGMVIELFVCMDHID